MGKFGTSGEPAEFYIIGNAIQITALSGIFGVTFSLAGDRWNGTLPYLFGTPANRMTMFLGRAMIHVVDGIFGVLIGFTWGVTLLGLDLSNTDPLALLLVIAVTTFSTSGLGLLLGSLSLVTRNVMFINNTAYFLLLVFSGSNIAIDRLPTALQSISNVLPLTRGIASARAIIGGASFQDVRPAMLEEIGIGVIYITCGYVLFRWIEVLAKRRGTLEVM